MKKVLMVIGGTAHPFASCAQIFKGAVEQTGRFAVEVTEDRAALADPSHYDAVVMYTVGGEMSRDQEQGVVNYVRGGKGLLAIHCANAEMDEFKDYGEMVGTAFVKHGPIADFTVETDGDAGDILPRLSPSFSVTDEFYQCELRTQAPLRPFQSAVWQFERYNMGYVRDYGEGRVMYTALGHDERTFRHPDFQDLVYKGLRYVCGLEQETPVRFGLLGYGPLFGMGNHHAQQVATTQGFELGAVCDRDEARLAAAKEEQGGGFATFTDAAEMAASGLIDLCVVILPHAMHAWGIKTLLEADLHVITEKPFAVTVAECDQVMALAKERGKMLSVFHNRHWDPDVMTVRHIVESGRIGEVFSIECNMVGYGRPGQAWRSHKPISGGAAYDMGAHQLEKVLQIVPKENGRGEKINRKASLYGHTLKKMWHDTTNEDFVRAYVRFDGGVEAQLVVSSISAATKPPWIVLGTKGSIVVPNWGGPAEVTMIDEDGQRYSAQIDLIEVSLTEAANAYYKNIADHLLASAPLIITPEWAKGPIQCIEGCEIAARQNKVVEVDFDF